MHSCAHLHPVALRGTAQPTLGAHACSIAVSALCCTDICPILMCSEQTGALCAGFCGKEGVALCLPQCWRRTRQGPGLQREPRPPVDRAMLQQPAPTPQCRRHSAHMRMQVTEQAICLGCKPGSQTAAHSPDPSLTGLYSSAPQCQRHSAHMRAQVIEQALDANLDLKLQRKAQTPR